MMATVRQNRPILSWAAAASLVVGASVALITGVAGPAGAAFPGENGLIAFATFDLTSSTSQIFTIEADGTGLTTVGGGPTFNSAPAWSPDGTRLAFDSLRGGNNFDVYVMAADGSDPTRLTTDPATDAEPAWSPGGDRLVFRSERDGNSELYVMNADGSAQTRLTDDPGRDGRATWSPGGDLIAFSSDRDGDLEIYVIAPDGSGLRQLTDNTSDDTNPSWSPDGSRIAFNSDRDGDHEIYVMDASGANPVAITDNDSADRDPAWSPDGTRFVFIASRDGNNELYVMEADGSAQTRLTNDPNSDSNPDWQPVVSDAGPLIDIDAAVASNGRRGQVRGSITCEAGALFLVEAELSQGPATARGRSRGSCTGTSQPFTIGFATAGSAFVDGDAEVCVTAYIGDRTTRSLTSSTERCQPVIVTIG